MKIIHFKIFFPKNSQMEVEEDRAEEVIDQEWPPVEFYMGVFLRYICETSTVIDVWIFIYIVLSLFDLMLKYIL